MNKGLIFVAVLGVLMISFSSAGIYGDYIDHNTGSKVYYENGKIIGVEDAVSKMSRMPCPLEKNLNHYVPQSCEVLE